MGLRSTGKLLLGTSRKTRIVSGTALFLAVCAFGAAGVAPMAPDASDLPVKSITQELALPELKSQIAALEEHDQVYVREEKVRPGDTLATLLNRLGVDDNAAADFIKHDQTAHAILNLRAGKRVQAKTSDDGELKMLSATVGGGRDEIKNVVVERIGDGFKSSEMPAVLERRVEMRTGEIRSSLFAATDLVQIPDSVALQIVDMFSTDIDFASDLRRGDRFNVVYETFWQNGDFVRSGRVLASEFINAGKSYQAVWFDEPSSSGGGSYYSFDGKSLKKAFLKSPLEFSRISSGFAMRVHPISGNWKQHKGVDFAAPSGTPIRASGNGVIDFAGVQGGYGNVIVIKHWSNYSTAYAHMSRFAGGIRKGTKVNQGDVIGYVGSTGWSTGPHLHYEFRVNNQPRDPMSVDVPNAQPLAGLELLRFRSVASDMVHRFALLRADDKAIKLAAK
ncbi:MAG: peptidoglycan DD-metalloendopeptidase family protein [Burkholderiales bacterium]|nr:peptidoglycan DD-metalloendopeptidase family protein [Burkholderiales bacterium]